MRPRIISVRTSSKGNYIAVLVFLSVLVQFAATSFAAESIQPASLVIDLDNTSGVQAAISAPVGSTLSASVVITDVQNLAAFSLEVEYSESVLSSPSSNVGSDLDRNPDANQAVLSSTGRAWACSPPPPTGDSNPSPSVGVAFLSCHSTGAVQGPSFSSSGGVVATVSFQAVGVGTTSLVFRNVSLYASDGTEIGSCNPTLVNSASCTGGTVTVQAAAVPTLTVDADPNTVGIQSQLNTGSATQVSVDILVANVAGLGSFSLELQYDQTKLVASTIGAGSDLDRNPNANQAVLSSTGRSWACSPPAPSGDVDSSTSVGAAFISCYSAGAQAGPDFASAGALVASVTFQVVGSGTAALSLRSSSLYNVAGAEIGSCGPVISVVATCGSASLTVSASGAATATKLGFSQEPTGGPSGTILATQPVVVVQSAVSQTVTTDNQTLVTLSWTGSGLFSCTGGTRRQVVAGVAQFSGCSVSQPGSGTLVAQAPALSDGISQVVTVGGVPIGMGYLRAVPSTPLPVEISVNGLVRDTWATNWLALPIGQYEVSFSDFPGFSTPAPQVITVNPGVTTVVVGGFTQLGTLHVTTAPGAGVGAAIFVDSIASDMWGLWKFLPAGDHQVCFGLAAGKQPPGCQNANVSAGGVTQIVGTFADQAGAPDPTNWGYLRVTTAPAVASSILVDGVERAPYGLTWLQVPPGNHTVSFRDYPGYSTPLPSVVNVPLYGTGVVSGTFDAKGILEVILAPGAFGAVNATIYVDGIARDQYGMYSYWEPGSHTVCFGAAAGFQQAPSCQQVLITSGALTQVIGAYTP